MPHDSQGATIYEGDHVYARVETFPGNIWEGVAIVMRILPENPICDLELLRTDVRTWTTEDSRDRNPLGYQLSSLWFTPATQYHVHADLVRATAGQVTVIYAALLGRLVTPPGFVEKHEHDKIKAELAEMTKLYEFTRGVITEALGSAALQREAT